LYRRYYIHYGSLTKNRHENQKLQRSWNKHGEDAFEFYVIEFLSKDKTTLREREQYWIDKIDPFYNIVKDVRSPLSTKDVPRSEAHRLHHSVAMRNSPIVQSEEYSKSQSEKAKAAWKRPECREKYAKYLETEEAKTFRSKIVKLACSVVARYKRSKTRKNRFLEGRSYNSKKSKRPIDADLVREVRTLYETGNFTHQDLADKFLIGNSTVRRIVKRQSWAFVD
jgi:group I intron endonuclease